MEDDALTFIKNSIRHGRIFWTYHVNMRLIGRFIAREDILRAVDTFQIIEEYPGDKYLPSCLVWARTDDDVLHIHIALDRETDSVRIITAYRPTLDRWFEGFRRRRTK
jgi:hypothetical protein